MNFVSEKELEDLKAKGGLRPEDGTMEVNKSLAEVRGYLSISGDEL